MAYQSEIEKLEQRFGEKPEQWFAALADAYRKAGELDMALDLLNTWIEKRPNYTSGHIVLGRCLLDKEVLDEAMKAFEGVLGLDPENIIAIRALAEIAQRRADPAGAEHWLERLLDVDPMNEEAHEMLAALRGEGTEPEVAPDEALVAEAVTPPQPEGSAAPFDPMAIAGEMKTDPAEEPAEAVPEAVPEAVLEEITLEMEPAEPAAPLAPAEPAESSIPIEPIVPPVAVPEPEAPAEAPSASDVDIAFGQPELSDGAEEDTGETDEGSVDGLVTGEVSPPEAAADDEETPEGEAHPALDGLEVSSFDDELAWDAGERTSHQISSDDIKEALEAHENSLDEAAHLLPGIEDEEVPHVGVEEREAPRVEGFEAPPEESDTQAEPVEGLEPTVKEAAAEPEPEPEFVEEAPAAPAAAEVPAAAPAPEEPAAEEALELIIPEETAAEEEPVAEPVPVVTETMAELYAQQGLFVEAYGIYEQLLTARPDDAGLQSKLAEMKQKATATKVPKAPAPEARFSAAQTGGVSVRVMFAEVLGAEPAAPMAAPEAPVATEEPPAEPVADEPTAEPAEDAPAAPGFDEFFGGEKAAPEAGAEPTTHRAEDEETDDEFRNWLKSLNT
jgi:tetratricopeptide (TPR) repeat protein